MIRPFGLQDVRLVHRLQRTGAPLAIEHYLTHPRSPLRAALVAQWAGPRVATYVHVDRTGEGHNVGFLQLMQRPNRPEADLLFIAPATPNDSAVWCELLQHSCVLASDQGVQRVYASPPDSAAQQECLRKAGFSPYTREVIYRLVGCPADGGPVAGFRSQETRDTWTLQRLYLRSTPRLVQQSEGALAGQAGSPPLSWWDPTRWEGVVWEPSGEVRAAVQVHRGRAGHWMRILVSPDLSREVARGLVEEGLHLLMRSAGRSGLALPIFASVRDYEVGLGDALIAHGFAPYADRVRMVKHTMSAARMTASSYPAAADKVIEAPARSQFWSASSLAQRARGACSAGEVDRIIGDATAKDY